MFQGKVVPKLLKISHYPKPMMDLYTRFMVFNILITVLNTITSTFIILFVIDIVGIKGLGIVLSISFLVTAITDYPTGVLGDWIGFKRVLFLAYVCFGVSSLFLSISTTFTHLIIAYIFLALGNGQASGALQSWFDNKYQTISKANDPNKEHYREFLGLTKKYTMIFGSVFFLIGGFLSNSIYEGRRVVFLGQSIGMFIAAFLFYLFLEKKENSIIYVTPIESKEKVNTDTYMNLLVKGIRFTFSSRLISLFLISTILIVATQTVWYGIILFPLYYGYTGSDAGAGSYRWVLWLTGAFISVHSGKLAKKLSEKDWLPKLSFFSNFFYLGITGLITYYIPVENPSFKIYGIVFIYLNFVFGYYFLNSHEYLKQKLLLDVIPDDIRNSIYSLLPALSLLFAAPLVIILTRVMDARGFSYTLALMFLITIVGSAFEYLALRSYVPQTRIEMKYDNYLQDGNGKSIQIPQQWYMSERIKTVYDEFSKINCCIEPFESPVLKSKTKKKSLRPKNTLYKNPNDLLYSMMNTLRNYASLFETAQEDGIISDEELVELTIARNDLLNVVETIAFRHIGTSEDHDFVDKLLKLIVELQEEEKKFAPQPIKLKVN